MKIRLFLSSALLFLASAVNVAASCALTADGAPVCAQWTRADVVFTGKALKVENASKSEGFPDGAKKVRFQVQQNFKGADNPTFTVALTADCAFNVKSGQTWIVYARTDIVLKSFSAFRGVKIEPKTASEEAAALQNIADGSSATAITGRFASAGNERYIYEPVEISATSSSGGKSFSARSDADGAFQIAVPDGNYRVELKFPFQANFKWDENLLGTSLVEGVPTVFKYEVRLNDGDCHFGFFDVTKRVD